MVNVKYKIDGKDIVDLKNKLDITNIIYNQREDGKDAATFFANIFPHFDELEKIDFIKTIIHTAHTPRKFESDDPRFTRGMLYEFVNKRFKYDFKLVNLYLKILVPESDSTKIIISLHISQGRV